MSNKKPQERVKHLIERTYLKYILFSSLLNACVDDNIKKQVNLLCSQVKSHTCGILCHGFNMDPFSSVNRNRSSLYLKMKSIKDTNV